MSQASTTTDGQSIQLPASKLLHAPFPGVWFTMTLAGLRQRERSEPGSPATGLGKVWRNKRHRRFFQRSINAFLTEYAQCEPTLMNK
jgi:hypothetical protein